MQQHQRALEAHLVTSKQKRVVAQQEQEKWKAEVGGLPGDGPDAAGGGGADDDSAANAIASAASAAAVQAAQAVQGLGCGFGYSYTARRQVLSTMLGAPPDGAIVGIGAAGSAGPAGSCPRTAGAVTGTAGDGEEGDANPYSDTSLPATAAAAVAAATAAAAALRLQTMGGELAIEGWRVRAVSHFPTVRLAGVALGANEGRWYYEVVLLTDGLMQIGWADAGFECDPLGGQGEWLGCLLLDFRRLHIPLVSPAFSCLLLPSPAFSCLLLPSPTVSHRLPMSTTSLIILPNPHP